MMRLGDRCASTKARERPPAPRAFKPSAEATKTRDTRHFSSRRSSVSAVPDVVSGAVISLGINHSGWRAPKRRLFFFRDTRRRFPPKQTVIPGRDDARRRSAVASKSEGRSGSILTNDARSHGKGAVSGREPEQRAALPRTGLAMERVAATARSRERRFRRTVRRVSRLDRAQAAAKNKKKFCFCDRPRPDPRVAREHALKDLRVSLSPGSPPIRLRFQREVRYRRMAARNAAKGARCSIRTTKWRPAPRFFRQYSECDSVARASFALSVSVPGILRLSSVRGCVRVSGTSLCYCRVCGVRRVTVASGRVTTKAPRRGLASAPRSIVFVSGKRREGSSPRTRLPRPHPPLPPRLRPPRTSPLLRWKHLLRPRPRSRCPGDIVREVLASLDLGHLHASPWSSDPSKITTASFATSAIAPAATPATRVFSTISWRDGNPRAFLWWTVADRRARHRMGDTAASSCTRACVESRDRTKRR